MLARRWILPAALAAAAAVASLAGASTPEPAPTGVVPGVAQPAIASTVADTLQLGHYSKRVIDDELSRAWFDAYLNSLDRERLYFLQSDIDEFSRFRDRLDDDIRAKTPTLEAAYAMHARLLQRMQERVWFANKVLSANAFDFSNPTATVELDRSKGPFARSAAELDTVWTARIADQILRMELEGETREAAIDRLRRRYERVLAERRSLDAQDVLEIYLAGLAGVFDPHSTWMKPVSKENFDIDMHDSLTGIGAVLSSEDGYTVIKELVAGGPADATQQIKPGDKVLAVAQQGKPPVDVVDMRLDKVVSMIRGPEHTVVQLTLQPVDAADPSERKLVNITRAKVKLDKAAAKGEVRDIDGVKVGVINVPSFYADTEAKRRGDPDWANTTSDVKKILVGFHDQGVQAVVVDLRRNGGGALDQAIQLTGLFLERGPVVQIRDRRGEVEVLHDEDPSVYWAGPLTVLTSEASASASEIFAAAIQDHGRGIVVGSRTTHGKGTVQNLLSLERYLTRAGHPELASLAGAVKFTTHKFYRVNGDSTQVKGVAADIVLPSPYEGLDIKESDLDNPLPWDRIAPVLAQPARLRIDLAALQAASNARVAASTEFTWMKQDLTERQAWRERDRLSLDRSVRKAELDRLEGIKKAREAARKAAGIDPENPPDVILEEALRITRDMVRMLRS